MQPVSPVPIEVQICSLCRLPWPDHLTKAEIRVWAHFDEEDDELPDVTDVDVTPFDCIAVLREKGEGPMGPPGPPGPMGYGP
jgi:hypothetical protein